MQILRPTQAGFTLVLAFVLGAGVGFISWASGLTAWPGVVVAALALWRGMRKPLRRWTVARRPLDDSHREWLSAEVPIYRLLERRERDRFERDVQFILSEWLFEGVQGVEVTDALRLSVAAGVATLLHGRPEWEITPARTILFYPEQFDDQYYADETGNYDGMAHAQGPVILSRPAVEAAWRTGEQGNNVVLHELAHLFDFADDFADGISTFVDPASISAWEALVRREMHRIRFGRSILRRYASKNRAEFFAVAIENFFGRPDVLAHHHPELFDALVALLNMDPRAPSRHAIAEAGANPQ